VGGSIEIRRVRACEAAQLRELRLETMADAPYAFSSSYERERGRPDEFWKRLATQTDEGASEATFIAVDENRWVGLAGVFLGDANSARGYVWGMWVAEDRRRTGVGRRLITAIRDWGADRGLAERRLSVSDSERSDPARRLYESLGFVRTGEVERMAFDPSLRADVMTLPPPCGDSVLSPKDDARRLARPSK
jgi:GNAT superfamily N-acetyltransferase